MRPRLPRTAVVAGVVIVLAAVVAGTGAVLSQRTAASGAFSPGSSGVGDPYFPLEGNGGYDVGHYNLALSYNPVGVRLAGVATITATATQNLSRFDLDLRGMQVSSVRVDGTAAAWQNRTQELQITPARGLATGHRFTVAVTYAGVPAPVVDSPILNGGTYGWMATSDGAFVGDEPDAASTWFPCNDHPSDKATFTFHITVPATVSVVANGDLRSTTVSAGHATYVWDETHPMATYLATVDIGHWTFVRGTTPGGIPSLTAYDPALRTEVAQAQVVSITDAVTDYWSTLFGAYPFTSTGAIVDDLPDVGFSLETENRPLYGRATDQLTIAHELAHQWFGDSVSLTTWSDIWLNEGFATFAMDLWAEHQGGPSTYDEARQVWASTAAGNAFWDQSIADPGVAQMFSRAVYYRGGMTLAALRARIGDPDFFALLRDWATQHRYGNATTAQFVRLAEHVSHQDLTGFFQTWLWDKTKPATFG
jgi:aminopeptidase N